MKKLFYSLIAIVIISSCTMEPQYKIDGNIDGLTSGSAVLKNVVDRAYITVDSVTINNGSFSFKGSVTSPEYFVLVLADSLEIPLFIDNVNISITADADSITGATIEGSELTSTLRSFNEKILTYRVQFKALYNEYIQANMAGDAAKVAEIEEIYIKLEEDQKAFVDGFISENSNSFLAPYIAFNYGNVRFMELEELKELVKTFGEEVANSKYLVEINDRIATLEKIAIGTKYTDFTINDVDGNPVSLSSVAEGNYVLVDFWAGWCGPCRAESPLLVELYAKYKEKGFEIFGVSLDKTKESWMKAIEEDGITWTQVSEIDFWNCSARDIYAFSSIPHNFIIDRDGIIIVKNLHGEELKDKLAELLD